MLLPGTQSLLFGRTKIKKYYSPKVKVRRRLRVIHCHKILTVTWRCLFHRKIEFALEKLKWELSKINCDFRIEVYSVCEVGGEVVFVLFCFVLFNMRSENSNTSLDVAHEVAVWNISSSCCVIEELFMSGTRTRPPWNFKSFLAWMNRFYQNSYFYRFVMKHLPSKIVTQAPLCVTLDVTPVKAFGLP